MQRSSSFNQNFNQKSLEHKANIPRSSSLNFNQTFTNLDNLSRILEEPEFDTWTNIYGLVISKPVLKRIFNYRLPNSYFCSSKSNVYCNLKCNFHHFMYQKYKKCCEEPNCPVEYRVNYCHRINNYSIEQRHSHNHALKEQYNNLVGIDDLWKMKISDLQKARLTAPKAILNRLTTDYRGIRVTDIETLSTTDGDVIPLPNLKQIQNFIRNHKDFESQVDMIEIEKYVNSKRININDENIGFFFSIFVDSDDLIRLGTGSDSDHFRVCMSSIKLLKQCAIYQVTGSAYCIDGTYKITFEEFVLVVFGRTDLKRRMHPIAFMLTSNECMEDYQFFYSSLKQVCENLNIPVVINYLMQDASKAESSALRHSFENVTNKNGVYYSRLIQIVPYYCNCPTFRDVAYCHHILAIIKFKLANIIIDPMYVEPEKPKKLQTKKVRRGRPSKTKALDK